MPGSGSQTLGVCIYSYAGEVRIGFRADATVVPDPDRLVEAFEAGGLKANDEVRIAGVRVGKVESVELDDGAFRVITARTTETVRSAIAAQHASGATARAFGCEPRVAFLSFSTRDSARHASIASHDSHRS